MIFFHLRARPASGPVSALKVTMRRAVRSSWNTGCPGISRSLTASVHSISYNPRIPVPFSPKITSVPRRTVMSSSQWTCKPRQFPSSGFKLLDQSVKLEEETLPTYEPEKYYPVNQGEIFKDRYQALAKIGYGVTSTVWLAKDLV